MNTRIKEIEIRANCRKCNQWLQVNEAGFCKRCRKRTKSMQDETKSRQTDIIGHIGGEAGVSKKMPMPHIHLFQHIGGGCGVGSNAAQGCDDQYRCECGAEFKAYSTPEVHFTMPNYIAGKEEPAVIKQLIKK